MTTTATAYRHVPVLSSLSAGIRRLANREHSPDEYTGAFDPTRPASGMSQEDLVKAYPKVFGTVAAAGGNVVCGVAGAIKGAALLAAAGSVAGPVGTVVGGALGLGLGFFLGKAAGATLFGAAGAALGKLFQKAGVEPPYRASTAQDTEGFSIARLPQRAINPFYTADPKLTEADVQHMKSLLQPGDIIATNNDVFILQPIQQMLGLGGDWVHAAIYIGDGKVVEEHSEPKQPSTAHVNTLETCLERQRHAMILRPPYQAASDASNVVKAALSHVGEKYDYKFDIAKDPHTEYCTGLAYRSVQEGAPDVPLAPPTERLDRPMVTVKNLLDTPGMHKAFSTGSDFSDLYLRGFC